MKHQWTDEEQEIVRRDYRGTNASAQAIADRLGNGITIWAVKGAVQRMGIAKVHRNGWTPGEDEQLAQLITRFAPATVARKMKRGVNSVVVRSKRLGLSRRVRDGWFTKREVCAILGVDHKWVQIRIDAGQLKASYHYGQRPSRIGMSAWHIEEQDLKEFIRRYPTDLTGRNVDLFAIVELLAGVAN